MHGNLGGPRQMMNVPDAAAVHLQGQAIEAQKELAAMQMAQNVRLQKATHAINLIGMIYQSRGNAPNPVPESKPEKFARDAAFNWLTDFFEEDSPQESGQAVREQDVLGQQLVTA